ncbi:MAG: FHA domain-containing protein, partial [Bdellovibrionales bacterium]
MARPLSCFLVTIQTEAGMVRKIVDDNPFTIGRSLEAAIAFSDNNISRAHVMVRNKNGKVMVEDQGSANGTYVNGVRLEARKSIPVEPKDVVRLGNSRVELTFTAIEKVFAENLVDQSDLPDEERDSIIDMLHGAHAEAQRLVKLGKDIHDNIIKSAEDRARTVEQNISGERDLVLTRAKELSAQTIEQARSTATQIISAAEEDAKKAVAAIHQRAAEVREQAEEYRHSQVAAAQSQADEVIQQSDKICQEMLQEAKNRINEITEVAKIQGRELVVKSKQEAESLIAAAIRESERIKKETEDDVSNARALAESDARQLRADAHKEADQLKLDSLNEAEKIKKDAQIEIEKRAKESLAEALNEGALKSEEMMLQAREKAQIERDTLISKAEESLRETRHEKKKLEGEMATNLKRMRGELDQLNTELENQQRLMQQKRKVFDDEVAYLRELKEREAQSIFDEKIKEAEIMAKQKLQEAEKIKTLKEEEADVYVQSKKLEFEKIKRRSEEQV